MMGELIVSEEICHRMKTQTRYTLQPIIFPSCIFILFYYIVTPYLHSDFLLLNGLPGVVILAASLMVIVKLLLYTKLEKSETRKFGSLLLGTFCFLIGEILYFYQQYFLQINIPYPSVADVPYLLANLFFSYFLLSSLFSLIIRKGLNPLSIILGSSVAIFPLYLIFSSAYNFSINLSSELDFLVNSLYYTFDALMLIPALVILLNLEKKDQFIFHWMFITVALILLVIGDVGYTYFSIISESLIEKFEWLWSIVYALGYLFLGIGIYWFDRIKNILEAKNINTFLEKDEMDRLKNLSEDELIGDKRSEYSEHIIGYQKFIDKLEDFVQRSKQIKILFYDKYWLGDEKVRVILDEIQQRAIVYPMQINILLPINQTILDNIISYPDNRNILVNFFDRPLNSNSLVFIFEEKYVAILDRKPTSGIVDNNTVFYGLITNKDKIVEAHISVFEKIWLVEKAVNM
jgi:hypothetical protein